MESRVELFARIRGDARTRRLSIRSLGREHRVPRRTVRQARRLSKQIGRRSRRGLISDKPVKSMTINDVAIGRAPRLWREWVEHRPVNGEFVEPLVEDRRFGGSQQREHDAFEPNRRLALGCIRSCQSNDD